MFGIRRNRGATPVASDKPPSPAERLAEIKAAIARERIELHRFGTPSAAANVDDGVLQFTYPEGVAAARDALLRAGFSTDEIDDVFFTPQNVLQHGRERQKDILLDHERRLESVARDLLDWMIVRTDPACRAVCERTAIGVADVPVVDPYTERVAGRGAVVVLSRGLVHLPTWFAALRALPRPWNELPLADDPLRRLVGTAGIVMKIMLNRTVIGTNAYMRELLQSEELRDGLGAVDSRGELQWAPSPDARKAMQEVSLCERFVIAHELAHVALGHTEIGPLLRTKEPSKHPEWRRASEHAADAFALQALVESSPKWLLSDPRDFRHLFVSDPVVDAMIALFLLLGVSEDPKVAGRPRTTHPPARERFRRIMDALFMGHPHRRSLESCFPILVQDQEVLSQMLGSALITAKPRFLSHPDTEMRWRG